jgi:hypothetical protein
MGIPCFRAFSQSLSWAPFSLRICRPGFRGEGNSQGELPTSRFARILWLSLVRSRVRRAAADLPLGTRSCPRSKSTCSFRAHTTSSGHPLLGGIGSDGRFRAGAERAAGQDTLRVLWEGTFSTNSLTFTRRITAFRGEGAQNTTRLTGTGSRISCNPGRCIIAGCSIVGPFVITS